MAATRKACRQAVGKIAQKSAQALYADAEKHVGKRPACWKLLNDAKDALGKADAMPADMSLLAVRNAYIRATFLAGQARSCAIAENVGGRFRGGRRKPKVRTSRQVTRKQKEAR